MKVVILAGGLAPESPKRPTRRKPRVEIGGRPILWHIMQIYSRHGFNDFVICLGYRGYIGVFRELLPAHVRRDLPFCREPDGGQPRNHRALAGSRWSIPATTPRPAASRSGYVADVPFFALIYGDEVADIDLGAETAFHKAHGRRAPSRWCGRPSGSRRSRAIVSSISREARRRRRLDQRGILLAVAVGRRPNSGRQHDLGTRPHLKRNEIR